jgi:hypothetical protein
MGVVAGKLARDLIVVRDHRPWPLRASTQVGRAEAYTRRPGDIKTILGFPAASP